MIENKKPLLDVEYAVMKDGKCVTCGEPDWGSEYCPGCGKRTAEEEGW